jgi:broad specificity phosphatase PhoE
LIYLARHGETDDNAPPKRVQGRRDPPLNERGREQARALAERVAEMGIAALWSSDQRRALETAEIVNERLGLELRVDARLAEGDWGDWQGRLVEDIQREDADLWAAWRAGEPGFRFPGGESFGEHMTRVQAALEDVAQGPQPALVVCHGGSIRCALARDGAIDNRLPTPNGELFPLP